MGKKGHQARNKFVILNDFPQPAVKYWESLWRCFKIVWTVFFFLFWWKALLSLNVSLGPEINQWALTISAFDCYAGIWGSAASSGDYQDFWQITDLIQILVLAHVRIITVGKLQNFSETESPWIYEYVMRISNNSLICCLLSTDTLPSTVLNALHVIQWGESHSYWELTSFWISFCICYFVKDMFIFVWKAELRGRGTRGQCYCTVG